MPYGRQVLNTSGRPVMVLADLGDADWKPGGVTIDWTTVSAATSDTTLADDTIIPSGQKGLRYGQILTKITATGLFGPYNSGVSDGRQTLARGAAYILNETVLEHGALAGTPSNNDNQAVIEGGLVWKARLLTDPSGTTTLPSTAAFEAVFPRVRYAQ